MSDRQDAPSSDQAGSSGLLDEATRLADNSPGHPRTAAALRALVERVQQAEEALRDVPCEHQRAGYLRMQAERNAARAKLDKVRVAVTSVTGEPHDDDISRDVLAILDDKDPT